MFQITTWYCCAGGEYTDGIVTKVAPIFRKQIIGLSRQQVKDWCEEKGFGYKEADA